jgi:8-amino-7-oxononanoate synthase
MRIFPHNTIAQLRRMLEDAEPNQLQIVVTESIFSMDGDAANLPEIVKLKGEFPFALLLDEAHGSGVYGENGAGYASECGVADDVDVLVVTLSKALGGIGGAVCGSRVICDAVTNFGRAYVYSTSIPPAAAATCTAAIEVMQCEPQRRERVRELARRVRATLAEVGYDFPDGDSPIIPLIVGEDAAALALAAELEEAGMLAWPIRPPTVARGKSRVRITLSCEHSDNEIERLCDAMKKKTPTASQRSASKC